MAKAKAGTKRKTVAKPKTTAKPKRPAKPAQAAPKAKAKPAQAAPKAKAKPAQAAPKAKAKPAQAAPKAKAKPAKAAKAKAKPKTLAKAKPAKKAAPPAKAKAKPNKLGPKARAAVSPKASVAASRSGGGANKIAGATRAGLPNKNGATMPKKSGAAPAKVLPPAGGPAPKAGDTAPDFSLEGSDGTTHSLSALRGKSVVVYFYPKDDTPGCTREAQGFEAARDAFAAKNAVVFGVSRDSIASHCRFRDKYGLGFVLLSDPDLSTHRAYGAWGEKVMYGEKKLGVIRSTFLVGPDGTITRAWPSVKVDGHVDAVLTALG